MTERLRILITDDEQEMRLVVHRALRNFTVSVPDVDEEVEFDINEAGTGEEALEIMKNEGADLLLLDLKMPGMNGLEVLDQTSRDHPDVMTIMITAYASIQTAVSATKQGAYDFLAKPFTPEELRSTIRKAVRHIILSRQAKKLAEEKRRVRFEFISVLAHELKSPLSAVEGYLYTLEEDSVKNDPDMYEHVLGQSRGRLQGMRKMISDLLDLTQVESGRKRRTLTEVDLVEAANAVIDGARARAKECDIEIHLEAPESLKMTADRGEIEIILNNLVSNAIKYNRDGGRVDIQLQRDENQTRIQVSDTGIGMSQDECSKLFHDFVRIKNRKTKGILGSGLGLSIVKKLAQLYEGDATVESEPDKGSAFKVVLNEPAPQQADQPQEEEMQRN